MFEHPVLVIGGLLGASVVMFGLAWLIEQVDDAHDVEPDPPWGVL